MYDALSLQLRDCGFRATCVHNGGEMLRACMQACPRLYMHAFYAQHGADKSMNPCGSKSVCLDVHASGSVMLPV